MPARDMHPQAEPLLGRKIAWQVLSPISNFEKSDPHESPIIAYVPGYACESPMVFNASSTLHLAHLSVS